MELIACKIAVTIRVVRFVQLFWKRCLTPNLMHFLMLITMSSPKFTISKKWYPRPHLWSKNNKCENNTLWDPKRCKMLEGFQMWPQNSNWILTDPLLDKKKTGKNMLNWVYCEFLTDFWPKRGSNVIWFEFWDQIWNPHNFTSLRTQFEIVFTFQFLTSHAIFYHKCGQGYQIFWESVNFNELIEISIKNASDRGWESETVHFQKSCTTGPPKWPCASLLGRGDKARGVSSPSSFFPKNSRGKSPRCLDLVRFCSGYTPIFRFSNILK